MMENGSQWWQFMFVLAMIMSIFPVGDSHLLKLLPFQCCLPLSESTQIGLPFAFL